MSSEPAKGGPGADRESEDIFGERLRKIEECVDEIARQTADIRERMAHIDSVVERISEIESRVRRISEYLGVLTERVANVETRLDFVELRFQWDQRLFARPQVPNPFRMTGSTYDDPMDRPRYSD